MNEQWLWEQCGLQLRVASDGELRWFDKDKEIVSPVDGDTGLPCIDLNNLFKYAMTKINLLQVIMQPEEDGTWYCGLNVEGPEQINLYESMGKDPADSLFQAIYKAFGGK